MNIWEGIGNNLSSIWDNTIYGNNPISWGSNTNSAIGTSINNNVNDKPEYGAVSGAINDFVNSGNGGFDWGALGKNLLGNLNFGGGSQQETPRVNFQPTMAQPGYVNTNFQNQKSDIAKNNLYDYLTR